VTSARRHLATAIGSAALGSLSSTAAEVRVQSKDDEPYPRALLHSFSLGHRNPAYQVKGAANEDGKGESIWGPVRAPLKSRTARPAMWPRITIIGTGQDVQIIRAFGPSPIASLSAGHLHET
jgi:hypothetical protein